MTFCLLQYILNQKQELNQIFQYKKKETARFSTEYVHLMLLTVLHFYILGLLLNTKTSGFLITITTLSYIMELNLSSENPETLKNQVALATSSKSRRILDFVFTKTYFDASV